MNMAFINGGDEMGQKKWGYSHNNFIEFNMLMLIHEKSENQGDW